MFMTPTRDTSRRDKADIQIGYATRLHPAYFYRCSGAGVHEAPETIVRLCRTSRGNYAYQEVRSGTTTDFADKYVG